VEALPACTWISRVVTLPSWCEMLELRHEHQSFSSGRLCRRCDRSGGGVPCVCTRAERRSGRRNYAAAECDLADPASSTESHPSRKNRTNCATAEPDSCTDAVSGRFTRNGIFSATCTKSCAGAIAQSPSPSADPKPTRTDTATPASSHSDTARSKDRARFHPGVRLQSCEPRGQRWRYGRLHESGRCRTHRNSKRWRVRHRYPAARSIEVCHAHPKGLIRLLLHPAPEHGGDHRRRVNVGPRGLAIEAFCGIVFA